MLSGKVIGRDTGYIILIYPDTQGKWLVDTTYLTNGKFKFTGHISQPSFATIRGYDVPGNYINIFLEAGKQTIVLENNKFGNVHMRGSKSENEKVILYKAIQQVESRYKQLYENHEKANLEYIREPDTLLKKAAKTKAEHALMLLDQPANEIRRIRIDFIKRHPRSYVSPTELYALMNYLSLDTAEDLFNNLHPEIKASRVAALCLDEIAKKRMVRTGMIVPDFRATEIKGHAISLSQFRGTYVLLNFWASWCVPCRKEIPDIKQVQASYRDKDFVIIAISLDEKERNWKEAIQKEGIGNWLHVLENIDIKRIFQAVKTIPAHFLIDREGRIIWNSTDDNKYNWQEVLEQRLRNH